MISRDQKIRLGGFLIIGFAVISTIIILLLGTRFTNRMDTYRIVFKDTSVIGVQVNSAVLFRGIRIGRIDSIEIDRNNINDIIIYISVNRGTPIKADHEAVFVLVGITGLRQIEIRGGTDESPFLKSGDTIIAGRTFLENVSERSDGLIYRVEQLLHNITAITNTTNQARFDDILKNIDSILSDSREPLIDSINNINTITNELNNISITLAESLSNIISNIETITTDLANIDLNGMLSQLNETTKKASNLIENLDSLIDNNTPEIIATINELKETVENLNVFSGRIARDPSLLLWRRRN